MKTLVKRVLLSAGILFAAPALAEPNVVVSIPPLKAIADVITGNDKATVIVPAGASPHSFAMKPSHARALSNADVIFWIGPTMETFLAKPVLALTGDAHVQALMAIPGVKHLSWSNDDEDHENEGHKEAHHDKHGHDDHKEGHHHHHGAEDPHIWLDPANAAALARAMAKTLAKADPANAAAYAANADRFAIEMVALTADIAGRIAPVRGRKVIVFHDAYRYFTKRFGFTVAGRLTLEPDRPPSARDMSKVRGLIDSGEIACVFAEPQFPRRTVDALLKDGGARVAVLDPLGDGSSYAGLLSNMASAITGCIDG